MVFQRLRPLCGPARARSPLDSAPKLLQNKRQPGGRRTRSAPTIHARKRESDETQGAESRLPLHSADLRRLFVFGAVLWLSDAQPGVFVRVSPADEYFYLCRLDGICDGRAAAVGFQPPARFSFGADGQCAAPVLRAVHAAEVPQHRLEKVLPDLRDVRRILFHQLYRQPAGGGEPRVVHVLCHPVQPHLLGGGGHRRGPAGVCHPF